MKSFAKIFAGKRVLVTGHTGFKGSWLCEWLLGLGSNVWGFSLPPPTNPSLFNQLKLASRLHHILGDMTDAPSVSKAFAAAKPDFVFHFAAQSIVRSAHTHPTDTWATNVMGSVNVLEALRNLKGPCAAVFVTTDKVYRASAQPHTEDDSLGARDPYGGSKAAVELAVDAWREAFFPLPKFGDQRFPRVALATARSGNVIGGGDWAENRLLPDCVRALAAGKSIVVRNPASVRPWQHVLDPLQGYLMLAAELRLALMSRRAPRLASLSGAFNFGPSPKDHRHVMEVVAEMLKHWPGKWQKTSEKDAPAEAAILRLDAGKARRILGWRPRRNFSQAVQLTTRWYRDAISKKPAATLTAAQIYDYADASRTFSK